MKQEDIKSQLEIWESHPGADQIRIAIKDLVKLQKDLLEVRSKDYLYYLMRIADWIDDLLADDINVFKMNRIFALFIVLKDDIAPKVEAKRKRLTQSGEPALARAPAGRKARWLH
jgi:hypothetical protein